MKTMIAPCLALTVLACMSYTLTVAADESQNGLPGGNPVFSAIQQGNIRSPASPLYTPTAQRCVCGRDWRSAAGSASTS